MRLTLRFFCFLYFLLFVNSARADGSKDLYPERVRGGRAYMESGINGSNNVFYSNARHFVYAKLNETIAVASSAQGIGFGITTITSPSGRVIRNTSTQIGVIMGQNGMNNRRAELAGPRDGYVPLEIEADEEGIWTVEFISPTNNANTNQAPPNVLADDNWIQPANQNLIAAWDVSVRDVNDSFWIKGRVFTNVINLYINGGQMDNPEMAFYGVNYVLTKDGYLYKVDGNGSIGLRFTYFVNNSGILDVNGDPLYKSSNGGFNARLHNPNLPDVETRYVTHKIFYTLPNEDLPKSSQSSRGETWLLNDIQFAVVKNIRLGSSENTLKNVNTKGIDFGFETNFAGRYKAVFSSKSDDHQFVPKDIIVQASAGVNTFHWDGKDGNGTLIPVGLYDIQVKIAAIDGEVHFPYFDMEINPTGLKLEKIERDGTVVGPAIVYWDDSDITFPESSEASNPLVNLSGISSYVNGHKWGTYSVTTPFDNPNVNNNQFTGGNSFGNNKAMNTWSYAIQVDEVLEKEILVEVADLEVIDVKADKDSIELNETITYSIQVKNNGPSDVVGGRFEYQLPNGFFIDDVKISSTGCASFLNPNINQHKLSVQIDIKNGCEATIILKAHANNVPDETYGFVLAEAGIVRPVGYTDPDATSDNIAENEPKSAQEECSPEGCNNIKTNNSVFLLEPFNERGQLALLKTAKHIDSNGSGFQEEGEEIEYSFTIRNIGEVTVRNLTFTDSLINSFGEDLNGLVLLPNQDFVFTRRYVISQQDVVNKKVVNQALILGKNPRNFDVKDLSGTEFTNNQKTIFRVDKKPNFNLRKSVFNKGTGERNQFTIGDTIIYLFEISHEGDLPVKNIRIIDSLLFSDEQLIHENAIKDTIIKVQFNYIINEEDIIRGHVTNTAKLLGLDADYGNDLEDISGTEFENDLATVTVLAKPPIANADYFELFQTQLLNVNVLNNDTKGSSGWNLGRIEIVEHPIMGDLRFEGLNIGYQQHVNTYFGEDSFTYRIIDNSRLKSEIVKVDLLIKKTVPIAVDDYILQYYNGSIDINPASNDIVEFSKLNPQSIQIMTFPSNGRLINKGNGIFSYESDKTFSGIDEFTYIIQDLNGNWSEPGTVKIEVAGLIIPNVITPNGDGLNDTFEIIGLYQFETVELHIFDRFKNSIYQNDNYENNWMVGADVPDGNYYYIIKATKKGQKPNVFKGFLLITRDMIR